MKSAPPDAVKAAEIGVLCSNDEKKHSSERKGVLAFSYYYQNQNIT